MDEDDPLVLAAHESPQAFAEAFRVRVSELIAEQNAAGMAAIHSPATSKAMRPRVEVPSTPVMVDPLVTLGHPPRPRKRGKR